MLKYLPISSWYIPFLEIFGAEFLFPRVLKKNPFSNNISAYLIMVLFTKSGKQSYSQCGVEWNLGNK